MVFSSLPVYLDPPNWPQQNQEVPNNGGGGDHQNPQLLPPNGGVGGSIRPGFMADRARQARLPPPELGQKCPRCDSTNTKFCYYNNYNLSQPRHFCKTCRRYWTKGGALRNVPVGGGCRRNKKSKSSTSKSTPGATSNTTTTSSVAEISGNVLPQQNTHLPFMTSLPNLSQYGNLGNIGLNFGGIIGQINGNPENPGFQTNSGGVQVHPHQHQQQFPFFEGFFPEGVEGSSSIPSARVSQLAPVKMEGNNQGQGGGLNLSRPVFFGNFGDDNNGNNNNNNNNNRSNHFWGGNNWPGTDLSGLNSSSTNNLL